MAYLRKGISCFELDEFESAKDAFEKSKLLKDQPVVRRWIRKCSAEIDDEKDDYPMSSTLKKDNNENIITKQQENKTKNNNQPKEEEKPKEIPSLTTKEALNDPIPPVKTPIRHDWYQSPTTVVLNIFIKNMSKDQVNVECTGTTCNVNIKINENSEFVLDLNLCDSILPSETIISCNPVKVEIKMIKDKQCKWLSLEKTNEQIKTLDWDTSVTSKPEYPSSSKIKKNWDIIDKEIEEDKPEGEGALNKLFQDIFSRGSDEQKKAMEKSFVESGGTVLSTNWDDVGAREVKGTAPEGAEIRKLSDLHS